MCYIKANFKSMYNDNLFCDIKDNIGQCSGGDQTADHILQCEVIKRNCPELANYGEVEYKDVFRNESKQLVAVKAFNLALNTMTNLSTEQSSN